MKKIIFLLSAILALGTFSACGTNEGNSSKIVTLNTFESYYEARRPDYRCFIGDVAVVENESFGNNCIRVTIENTSPMKYERTTTIEYTPRIIFQAVDTELGYDLSNATVISAFSIDVVNENEHDAILAFWVEGTNGILYDTFVDLPAKADMTAVFPINSLMMKGDGEKCTSFVVGIIDEYANDKTISTNYSFDNFRAQVESVAPNAEMDKVCEENEVLKFEQETDVKYVDSTNISTLRDKEVPAGGIGFAKDTPIGNALKLTWFGKQLYEGVDLSYYNTNGLYMQMYGVKIHDELFKALDLKKLQNGYVLTAQAYNADATKTQRAYLVLVDEVGNFARGEVELAPLGKGKITLKEVSNLNFEKLTGLYLTYDTVNAFNPAVLYANDIRFEKEA